MITADTILKSMVITEKATLLSTHITNTPLRYRLLPTVEVLLKR